MRAFLKIFGSAVGIAALGIAGLVGYYVYEIHRGISKLDAVPLSAANYQPAAPDLVKLCQSDPRFYAPVEYFDSWDPAWVPSSVSKLHPEIVHLAADRATVTWGGGFYHCGWELVRGQASTDGLSHSWTISFVNEGGKSQVLQTISVRDDVRFTSDEFIDHVLAEFDRRLAQSWDEHWHGFEAKWYVPAARCFFLEAHQRLDLLPGQVRKSAATYPHDWRDVLLGYLLDHNSGDASAGGRLSRWAEQTNCQAGWIYAAYGFYQAGDSRAGDDAVSKAIACNAPDPQWIDNNVPQYELAMAVRLYKAGNFADCVKLCDGILGTRHSAFTNKSSVQMTRDAAAGSTASQALQLTIFDKYTSEDLFGGFDLSRLYAAASQPATQPAR